MMSVKEDRFYTDIHRIALALERMAKSLELYTVKSEKQERLEDDGND